MSSHTDATEKLRGLSFREALSFYDAVWDQGWEAIAEVGRHDRFFLLVYILDREDACKPWIYDRCREVETAPNGFVDIWAREHYKSTVITFAGAIQEILKDPEITIGIFSHTKPAAKKFLSQIKYEFENNDRLRQAYPDICWDKPSRDAPRWSEDRGIVVKRRRNPREATVEAHGLVDGMPTGMHYKLRIYDDVVTEETVTTPEMIEKVTDRWRMSMNLGTEDGRMWIIGTFYHFNDTYRTIIQDGVATERLYAATDDGTEDGEPVLQSRDYLAMKRRAMGPYIYACQMLCNPVADAKQNFDPKWLKHHHGANGDGMNVYIIVDPANEKKKHSDYTAIWVIGCAADRNYYVLDMVRDRLNLKERADFLFSLHRKWKPKNVGYEKYGKDSDIQHFEDRMGRDNYRFTITALGGQIKKPDRIRSLIPVFEQGRILLPEVLYRENYERRNQDLVNIFVEQEYKGFPVATHDDMLDSLARINDPAMYIVWPKGDVVEEPRRRRYERPYRANTTWMAI